MVNPHQLIRFQEKFIHPDHFRGKGWRGLFIRFLNFLRFTLEVLVQKRILMLNMNLENYEAPERKKALQQFYAHLRADEARVAAASPLLGKPTETPLLQPRTAESRYEAPRLGTADEPKAGFATSSFAEMVTRYTERGAQRYTGPEMVQEAAPLDREEETKQ